MLAHAEAYIDFEADETNDLRPQVFVDLGRETEELSKRIEGYLREGEVGSTIREGFRIAILGPPNAGKSTLMNMLAKRKVTIVSEIAGTTRDLVSTSLNLFGYHVILTDTAGLRDGTSDKIEREGILLAQEEVSRSHGLVFVLDASDLDVSTNEFRLKSHHSVVEEQLAKALDLTVVINKIDLLPNEHLPSILALENGTRLPAILTSIEKQANVDALIQALEKKVKDKVHSSSITEDSFLVTRQRHRELLEQTL